MSKKSGKTDNNQMTIFDALNRVQKTQKAIAIKKNTAGTFSCINRLRQAIKSAIKNSDLSVHQIAGEISHLTDETVTADQIYTWTRQSDEPNGRPTRHIPSRFLPAFCHVTKNNSAIEIMGEMIGLFVMPGPDALRAEIQREEAIIRKAREANRKRKLLLDELEGRHE